MNLLVTNTRNAQAYAIIRSLRPRARRIVATVSGATALAAYASHAALARGVDRRYRVPDPTEDWRRGRIGPDNTPAEERYVQAVLAICRREAIDVAFPSWDPYVYVFAKNRARFQEAGVLVPVPPFELLVSLMDKYACTRLAAAHGLACPRTLLPTRAEEVMDLAAALGVPLVAKPRFSSGGRGIVLARTPADLAPLAAGGPPPEGWPCLQEYVPGATRWSAMVLIDARGQVKELFCERWLRALAGSSSAEETIPPPPEAERFARFLADLGYRGAAFGQFKVDPRDGVSKLLEVNVRMSAGVWTEMRAGIDVPWLVLQIARGEEIPVQSSPPGRVELWVAEDLLGLAAGLLADLRGRGLEAPVEGTRVHRALARLRAFAATYRAPGRVVDFYTSDVWREPLVALAYWAQLLGATWRNRRNLALG